MAHMAGSPACWRLDLNIVSASHIPNVRQTAGARMKVYAIVSINNAPNLTYTTPVDYVGGSNPRWNTRMPYNVPYRSTSGNHDSSLCITLFCERSFGGPRLVCSVNCSLRQLFRDRVRNGYREFNVGLWNNMGMGFGSLRFHYRFLHMWPVVSRGMNPNGKHVFDRHRSVLHHGICKALVGSINAPGVQLYALMGETVLC